jgi:hypothetical protein
MPVVWEAVVCPECTQTWVVRERRQQQRVQCRHCGTRRSADRIKVLGDPETKAGAIEVMSRYRASRAGREAEYGRVLDEHGTYADQKALVEERTACRRDGELGRPIGADRYSAAAELVLDRSWNRFADRANDALGLEADLDDWLESRADDAQGLYDDVYEELVDTDRRESTDDERCPADEISLRVRESCHPGVDVRIEDPSTAPRAHRALLENGLDEQLVEALRAVPGESPAEKRSNLWDAGADAVGGLFSTLAAEAACLVDEGDGDRPEAVKEFLCLSRSLGHGQTGVDERSDRGDLISGPVRLFGMVEDLMPTIAVELTGEWFERGREQRADVLKLLVELAKGSEVILEVSSLASRKLYELHRGDLPVDVTRSLDPRRVSDACVAAGEMPARIEERVGDALDDLEPEGTATAVLCALVEDSTQSMRYDRLRHELGLSEGHPRVVAARLEEQGLAERLSCPDGRTELSLLPAGKHYVELVSPPLDEQRRSTAGWAGEKRNDPPKNLPPCRVNPREHGRGEDEAADTAGGDQTDQYEHGPVDVGYMAKSRQAAVTAAANSGEISLVDADLERQNDGRRPYWGQHPTEERLVVGAEYHNPMQYIVCLARALCDPKTWNKAIDAEQLDKDVFDLPSKILREGRNLGWLRDEDTKGVRYIRRLIEDALDRLLEMCKDHHHERYTEDEQYEDRDDHRGEILRLAHGIHGVMSQLCDLTGVEVVREVRLPEFSRHWSRDSRREDLCEMLGMATAIGSSYGHYVPYRLLLEDREWKRKRALDVDIDSTDPFGELIGSFVLAGDGVDDLKEELREELAEPKELHPEAPTVAVDVPITSATSLMWTKRAAELMGEHKSLGISRQAVSWLHSLVRSPYSAAEVFDALERESPPREIYLDELRLGIGSLREGQLLPEAAPSARSGVLVLLLAESAISQNELARRADISAQSWRNHRDALAEAGLVEETPGGWRLRLPFRRERHEEIDQPWPFSEEPSERLAFSMENRDPRDVLMELAYGVREAYDIPIVDQALQYPTDMSEITQALDALEMSVLLRVVEASVGIWERKPTRARIGPRIEDASIRNVPPKSGHGGLTASADD